MNVINVGQNSVVLAMALINMDVLFQPWMLTMSATPQPTFKDLTAQFDGPDHVWAEATTQASLQWPSTGPSTEESWSMEVHFNVIIVRSN